MFFQDWSNIYRTLIVGVLAYGSLVFFLRISGKRTLTKMNAFDLVVTVALGSTLATILLTKDVPLLQGITAYAVLILMQYLVAWSSVRSSRIANLVKSQPALLLYKGKYLQDAMRRERVTKNEIQSAIRNQGYGSTDQMFAVILETDGSFSVIPGDNEGISALTDIQGFSHLIQKQPEN